MASIISFLGLLSATPTYLVFGARLRPGSLANVSGGSQSECGDQLRRENEYYYKEDVVNVSAFFTPADVGAMHRKSHFKDLNYRSSGYFVVDRDSVYTSTTIKWNQYLSCWTELSYHYHRKKNKNNTYATCNEPGHKLYGKFQMVHYDQFGKFKAGQQHYYSLCCEMKSCSCCGSRYPYYWEKPGECDNAVAPKRCPKSVSEEKKMAEQHAQEEQQKVENRIAQQQSLAPEGKPIYVLREAASSRTPYHIRCVDIKEKCSDTALLGSTSHYLCALPPNPYISKFKLACAAKLSAYDYKAKFVTTAENLKFAIFDEEGNCYAKSASSKDEYDLGYSCAGWRVSLPKIVQVNVYEGNATFECDADARKWYMRGDAVTWGA